MKIALHYLKKTNLVINKHFRAAKEDLESTKKAYNDNEFELSNLRKRLDDQLYMPD